MSDNKSLRSGRIEGNAAANEQHTMLFSGDVGASNAYSMDPTAAYRQHSSEPAVAGDNMQQSHYLPMEPPIGSQPVLGYGMGYVPSQAGGEGANMYGYAAQVPMQPMMQSGDASGSFANVPVSSSLSQGRNKPAKRKQVKNACVNCQKACKKCDDGRPCQRCVKYNLVDTCVNSPRKERKKGVKRGPYKRRQKADHDSDIGHGSITAGEEESVFPGSMMGTMPTVGIPGQAMPTQDISYYPAYYPTQQPMIYDPNQLPQGQPGSYYYMSAPPPPPPHQSHQLHPSTMSAEQQQQQQQQQQQMGMLPQQAPHPGYYYQQYYQAPPPPIAQPTQHSHTFSSSAMGMHQQGQIGGIPNASVSPSDGQPQLTTQQGNDGHSFSLSGGLQHTAAVMIAPVIALSPTMTYKRRDSKMDILSELCTAVLDRDKQRDQPGGDSDASVTEDDCRQVDEAKLSTNWMGTRHDISNNKTLFDEWKPMHDNKKETWNDRWDRHTTPPPSPKMESYRRASSADMLCEKDYAVQRNSSLLDKSSSFTPAFDKVPSQSSPSDHGYRRRRPSTLPPLVGLNALGIMTPEHSPRHESFPGLAASLNDVQPASSSDDDTTMWPSRQQDNTDDTSPLLPSNWPHLLPAPNQSGSLSQPDKVLDALLPQRRLSAPEICTQAKDSIELRRYSDTMKDCKASGWLKQQELLKTLDDTLTTPSNQQKSTANDKTESTAMNPVIEQQPQLMNNTALLLNEVKMEQEVPSLTASISLTHSNSNNNTTNENNNNTDLPMTATATIENGHSSVSNANSTALVNKMDYEEEEGEISDMNSNNIDHDDNNDHHSVFNF